MMERVFRVILNMSYTGALVLLAVLPLRFLLRKSPRWLSCALWLLPLFRLLCPVSFQSALALLPGTEPLPGEFLTARIPRIHTGIPMLNTAVNPALEGSLAASPAASANPAQLLLWALGCVWLAGACAMLVYALVSGMRLRERLRFAVRLEPGVYESDRIPTAFVWGVRRPMVCLPAGLSGQSRAHVLLHERAHIRRRDYLLQPLFFLALALHWFNPLAWLLYALFARDMELACDESALKHAGGDIRRAYSATLLALSAARGPRAALAFGQSSTKARIKSILSYKKPAFWVGVGAVVVLCAAGALLLSNPPGGGQSVGIIGGADGPTQIYISSTPAPQATPAASAPTPEPTLPLGDSVVFYEGGKAVRVVPVDTDEARYFINAVIFDHMIRSAAWPALDMRNYPDRIDIHYANSPAAQGLEFSAFHVFLKDGAPCHQMGDGMYSAMARELYDELQLFGTPEFPEIVLPTPRPDAPTPSPAPVPAEETPPQPTAAPMPANGVYEAQTTAAPMPANEVHEAQTTAAPTARQG